MKNVRITLIDLPLIGDVEVIDDTCKECGHPSGYKVVITLPFRTYPEYFLNKLCPGWKGEDY